MIDFAQRVPTDDTAPATTPTTPATPSTTPVTTPTIPVPTAPTPIPFPRAELERLGDQIAELAAHIHAATYRLLVLVREFDQREGWGMGFKTCAHWLSWRTGIALGPAREKVRVAHALEHLPLLSRMMESGEFSYSKIRALTRIATPETEQELVDFARVGTASHVERLVRAWRRVDRLEEEWQERERHRTRELELLRDADGMYVLRARLDPEVGAVLMRALEAAGDALYGSATKFGGQATSGSTGSTDRQVAPEERTMWPQRRADAIGLLAERALQAGLEENGESISRADRFQVVVHVDAEALHESSESGDSMFENGVRVPAGTSRRIACDASRVIMTHESDGSVLDVGRKTRTVPPAIRRALDHRDGGCRFPGCGLRFCDAHHIKHWADGGETRLDNLALLCRRHHRAVHEEGFRVEIVACGNGGGGRDADGGGDGSTNGDRGGRLVDGGACRGNVRFYWPDGRPFPDVPTASKLPDDPVAALESTHSQLGIQVDPETTTPLWNGERFHVGYAIYTLWRP